MKRTSPFRMKYFKVEQEKSALKVGTDGVMLGAIAAHQLHHRILDIGTGTGIVALMLAQKYPEAFIEAVEIDEQAASEADLNFRQSPWKNRLRVSNTDLKDFVSVAKFDLIVSNPPYFSKSVLPENKGSAIARHDQSLTLNDLFSFAKNFLTENGAIEIIIPWDIVKQASWNASCHQLYLNRTVRLLSSKRPDPERVIMRFTTRLVNNVDHRDLMLPGMGSGIQKLECTKILDDYYLYL